MSDLKFSCPSCGQHIQCPEDYVGENIPCPSCAHLVRVPQNATVVIPPSSTANTSAIAEDSNASYLPKETSGTNSVPTLEENFEAAAGIPGQSQNVPLTEREREIAAARAAHPPQGIPPVKPRLSFILSGGEAPIARENEAALPPTHPPPEIKTVNG